MHAADLVKRLAERMVYLLLRSLFILFTDSVSACSLNRLRIFFPYTSLAVLTEDACEGAGC